VYEIFIVRIRSMDDMGVCNAIYYLCIYCWYFKMNYAEIVDISLSYADRADNAVTSRIDLFMRMVESRINRLLVIEDMSIRYVFPEPNPTNGRYALPIDFSAMRDIVIVNSLDTTDRLTLSLINPEQMNTATSTVDIDNSLKHFYQVLNSQIVIQPIVADGSKFLEIVYYGNIVPLTSTVTTNWLSNNHPDLYIDGILVEINAFVKDPEATTLWDARFKQVIGELMDADNVLVYSGTPLQTRIG
jgi:hypothetical protein